MSANQEGKFRDRPWEIYLRPAQLGDICVLLEPTNQDEISLLRERQATLQALFWGKPIKDVHLTCQRFRPRHEQPIESLAQDLRHALVAIESFPLTALSLQTLYVPVLHTNILKWKVQVTQDLRRFVTFVEQALKASGVLPLYTPGFVSSLISALKDVPDTRSESLSAYVALPYHLFTVGKVVLSRIIGPNEFEILDSIQLIRFSIPSLEL